MAEVCFCVLIVTPYYMSERIIEHSDTHRVLFTRHVFSPENETLNNLFREESSKVLVFIDSDVSQSFPRLENQIKRYIKSNTNLELTEVIELPGGEAAKNDFSLVGNIWDSIDSNKLDRHSYIFVIGGGAILDLVSFAASTAHRGIRHVRFPTTTLSQGDGGVGVKNGVNWKGKKNWIGTFSVPYAVVSDFAFLESLPKKARRAGIIEAIKVALVRDAKFYDFIEKNNEPLSGLDQEILEQVVKKSAEVHVDHIVSGGDPFERGSARPLDFGHWAAHKLEQVSNFKIGHGEAVAIGCALDLVYSKRIGLLDEVTCERILNLIRKIGFATYATELAGETEQGEPVILAGLEEFREHLGGELTVTLIEEIGNKVEVHEMDQKVILDSMEELAKYGDSRMAVAS